VSELRLVSEELATGYELQIQSKLSDTGDQISCRKGCSNCCYHPVLVTVLEGIRIYQWLAEQRLWAGLKKSLVEHSDKTLGLSLEIWLMSRIPCPLVTDKGLCRAYPARPFSCKVTYSVGDPAGCEPHAMSSSTGLIPKRAVLDAIAPVEADLLRRHGLPHVRVPLSTALLYGERIVKEDLDLEDFQRALSKDIDAINQS
jgi:Fe-S-cluster containining protein